MCVPMTKEEIRQRRKDLGLTREEFAEKLGFSGPARRCTISRWESGKRTPSPQTIKLMDQLRPRKAKKQ